MPKPDLPQPRKQPKQSRSVMLVEAIQQACLKILEQEGPEQLTTQRIADVAGINIASLYQYFPNKEAVLAEVFQDQVRQYKEAAVKRLGEIDRLSRVSLEDTLAAIIAMEIEQRLILHRMDPAFYQAYQHSFDIHRQINDLQLSQSFPGWDDWLREFLELHRQRLRTDDIDSLSRMLSHTLSGVLLSVSSEEPELLEQTAFREELLTLLLRYLCRPGME
ncbi:TetR/AcrR family transcriptional regulator [Seongchinamella sediminis]|nr:TetR/AcrR family transcriptional regulator [Seongchinamella sediminis]